MRCQICDSNTRIIASKEKNVSCGDYFEGHRIFSPDIGNSELLECYECGFAFFPELHQWSDEIFIQKIYNDDYYLCDTPFLEERPQKIAQWLIPLIANKTLLDYGGGKAD